MPSYSTPSTNLSTGLSTKPTRLVPDYLSKNQNFLPLSVFFAGTKEPEADPDSLFGLRMPEREKTARPPKEKKAKGGDTSSSKGDKDDSEDSDKKEKGAQKGPQSPERSQTSKPRPQQATQAQSPQQGAQGAAGAKQEARGTMWKSQKCRLCSKEADKRIIWADGRAYYPVCSDHVKAGKADLTKRNGKMAAIVAVKTVKNMNEALSALLFGALFQKGQSIARSEMMTTTANVPTLPVPIGAGDGRKFLDRPDDDKRKKKKKKRPLSRSLYILLRQ